MGKGLPWGQHRAEGVSVLVSMSVFYRRGACGELSGSLETVLR